MPDIIEYNSEVASESLEFGPIEINADGFNTPIYFDHDKYNIKESEQYKIDAVVSYLIETGSTITNIIGNTSAIGADVYNYELSVRRADAVEQSILSAYPDYPGSINKEYLGETQSTGENVPEDRRVDINIPYLIEDPVPDTPAPEIPVVDICEEKMRKVSWDQSGITSEVEIRSPYPRRTPNERPFFIKMVDSDYRNHAIQLDCGLLIHSLKLSPNPVSLTINSSKIINRYNTMTRWVEEHWGDEIDTISFSGNSFSFFAYEVEGAPNVGLTLGYRNLTKPFQQLRELARLFHYNGIIYQDNLKYEGGNTDQVKNFLNSEEGSDLQNNHPLTGLPKERLYINLYYDYISALGYFETFDINEEDESPYKFTYNIIFKAEKVKWHQGTLALTEV